MARLLLLPHYLPVGKAAAAHLGRLLTLVKGGGPTAAALLRHTPSLATPPAVVSLLSLLLGASAGCKSPPTLFGRRRPIRCLLGPRPRPRSSSAA